MKAPITTTQKESGENGGWCPGEKTVLPYEPDSPLPDIYRNYPPINKGLCRFTGPEKYVINGMREGFGVQWLGHTEVFIEYKWVDDYGVKHRQHAVANQEDVEWFVKQRGCPE